MKKTKTKILKIYAVKVQYLDHSEDRKEISRKAIGVARLGLKTKANEISRWKANQLYKAAEKAYLKYKGITIKFGGGKTVLIMDELGRTLRSGYMCWSYYFE